MKLQAAYYSNIIRLVRPQQYIKNAFVLVGIIFSYQWDLITVHNALLAFIAFCLVSSSVYILNDIVDADYDRQHPIKKYRPIASGVVPIRTGWILSGLLCVSALYVAISVSISAFGFVLVYGLINVGYSLYWKHIAVFDVFVISAGFMLRILVGTIGIGIAPSSWLLLCGLMLTLFLGFTKRMAELLSLQSAGINDHALTRRVLDDYNSAMIEQFISISAACTILAYSLYAVSAETIARHSTDALIYTVPFVIYGIFRYVFLLHFRGLGNDTAKDLYSDRHLLVTVVGWVVTSLVVLR